MQTPTIGRFVHVKGPIIKGERVHAAIVTGVHNRDVVDVTLFPRNGAPECRTNVQVFGTEAEGDTNGVGTWCFWPPRTGDSVGDRVVSATGATGNAADNLRNFGSDSTRMPQPNAGAPRAPGSFVPADRDRPTSNPGENPASS